MKGFRVNYTQVVKQANKINDLSEDLGKEIQKLVDISNSARSNWLGPASAEFQKHLDFLISDMRKTKDSMLGISFDIKNVATTIQEEDEKQAELASQLKGDKISPRKKH